MQNIGMKAYEKRITELEAEVRELKEIIKSLVSENAELKARLNKNSKNSGKPPSSDGYLKPVVKNSRESSGKPTGRQKNHIGHTKAFTEMPDKIVDIPPQRSCTCGGEVIIDPTRYTTRQVTDIPPVEVVTTEYRAHEGVCSVCVR